MTAVAIIKLVLFILGTATITWVSRASLSDVRAHGFYRYFAWESILALFLLNVDAWFVDPFKPRQLLSWLFLIVSPFFVVEGVRLFRKRGLVDEEREGATLLGIEKTTALVTTGLYRYIRHPFYSSLLFLGWGILLKHITWVSFALAAANTLLLVATAKIEEKEDIAYFGEPYREYMHQTKMFVPLIF